MSINECHCKAVTSITQGPLFIKKPSFYWHRDCHYKADAIVRQVYDGDSYIHKTASLQWIQDLGTFCVCDIYMYECLVSVEIWLQWYLFQWDSMIDCDKNAIASRLRCNLDGRYHKSILDQVLVRCSDDISLHWAQGVNKSTKMAQKKFLSALVWNTKHTEWLISLYSKSNRPHKTAESGG